MSIPYVIEGEGSSERMYDLYSRLLKDRIIFLGRGIDDVLANSIVAQLLFLEAEDSTKDITMYINSRGGIVTGALAIYDTINYIKPDVSTICVGEAISAAAFLLAAGAKGKRYALKHSRVMLHQVSAGAQGHVEDMMRTAKEAERLNQVLVRELAMLLGKTVKKLRSDIDRDYYMSADEAKKYGVVDKVLKVRG